MADPTAVQVEGFGVLFITLSAIFFVDICLCYHKSNDTYYVRIKMMEFVPYVPTQGDRPLPAPREAGPWTPAFGGAGLGRLGEWRPPGPSRFCFRLCFFFSVLLFAPM